MWVMIDLNLEEDTTYEVLVTTINSDNSVNTKPFGMKFKEDNVILNLYSNTTLKNIMDNHEFYIQLTSNPLLFTKALLNRLETDDYVDKFLLKDANHLLKLEPMDYHVIIKDDLYSTVKITRISSRITSTQSINQSIITINRATNKIMELLVKLSRIHLMDKKQLNNFKEEVNHSSRFIIKEGNETHIKSLTLIKQEINKKE